MNRLRYLLLYMLLSVAPVVLLAQGGPIGQWQSHLAYTDGIRLAEVKNRIYCATRSGLFNYDRIDNSVTGLSTVDGFSDVSVRAMGYSAKNDMLFIGYQDGNIDILHGNDIINVNSFKLASQSGVKLINNFTFNENICYISTSLGVLEFNMKTMLFGSSMFRIHPDCKVVPYYDAVVHNNYLYAAWDGGVIRAPVNSPFIENCASWKYTGVTDTCLGMASFGGKLWAIFANDKIRTYDGSNWTDYQDPGQAVSSIAVSHDKLVIGLASKVWIISEDMNRQEVLSNQQNHAFLTDDNTLWLAKDIYGMIALKDGDAAFLRPGGPVTNNISRLWNIGKDIWATSGNISDLGAPAYNNDRPSMYSAGGWKKMTETEVPTFPDVRDVMHVRQDTVSGKLWMPAMMGGLISYDQKTNTATHLRAQDIPLDAVQDAFGGIGFDKFNTMWMTNYRATYPLLCRTAKGQWNHFNLPGTNVNEFTSMLADDFGQIWMLSPREGTVVYSYNRTLSNPNDDDYVLLGTERGNGALPNATTLCMAQDRNGQVWIGTSDGVAVFPDSRLIFGKYNWDAQKPWVKNGDESGFLLSGQSVTAIAVDGGNRKWFGTNNGIWLTNPEGDKLLAHFTTENSPLLSDEIRAISVNGETGEVFISTGKGLISFRSTATDGGDQHGDVYAYPNPVKPGYSGPIAIRGLVKDANVKITDVTGNLVYETTAEGGQAIWYGKNFSGQDAASGVYLVFSTNSDGTETAVTKILIIR